MQVLDLTKPLDREVLQFFSQVQPCWFDGCAELRRAYDAEIDAIGGEACTGCARSPIIRKYMVKVRQVLQARDQA